MVYFMHYYSGNTARFRNILEHPSEEAAIRLSEQDGRAYRRFRNFAWYRAQREQTEQWLYQGFLEKGGAPETRYPLYGTLNPNGRLQEAYGRGAAWVSLALDQIRPQDISFTLGDSVAIQVAGGEKTVYTLRELTCLAQHECGSLEQYIVENFQNEHYIEAQLWNRSYFIE